MPIRRCKTIALVVGAVAVTVLAVAVCLSWPHLRFWWLFESMGKNAKGYLEYRHRQTGIVMVRVPGGTFWMGAQKEDPKAPNYDLDAQDDEGPVHAVELSPFLVGKFEVSQAEWKGIMGSNPSNFTNDDLPVEQVSWDEVQKFGARTGLRLPTEAQWEYACRAKTAGEYGGIWRLEDLAWYDENSGSATHPVGQKQPNHFGLHDMRGNVWEWCADVYDATFYSMPEAVGPDPLASSGSAERVVRGGGWTGDVRGCSSACRKGLVPSGGVTHLGFRPVAPVP